MRETAIAALRAKEFIVGIDQAGKVSSVFAADLKIVPEDVKELSVLSEMRKLSLFNCAHDNSIWPLLERLPNLEEFELWAGFANATKGPADIEYPGIEDPPVRRSGVTDDGAQFLQHVPKLTVLGLRCTYIGDPTLAEIAKLKSLEHLNLNGTQVTGAGFSHLMGLRHLEWLSCVGTKVGDDGLKHIADIVTLTELELQGTKITDAGLADLENLTKLELLSINDTGVSETGLVHLLPLKHLKTLYVGSPITAVGVEHLKQLPNLRTLYIGSSNKARDMTDAERDWVFSQLPGVYRD